MGEKGIFGGLYCLCQSKAKSMWEIELVVVNSCVRGGAWDD